MDPIAHTLFGATLAETGLRHKSRYATATLIAAANLPDIDALATFLGRDTSLFLRRGWTHGILAMVVLPLVLVGIIWALNSRKTDEDARDGPPFRLGWIVLFAYLATWSHPALDWMNTYGVRLLMPFDGTWFYGDTLFIIDPWFWLLGAAGVVLARSKTKKGIIGWSILGTLASALVLLVPMVPWGVKALWAVGVVAIVAGRYLGPRAEITRVVSRTTFGTLLLYFGIVYGIARIAEDDVREQYPDANEVQANPAPGVPFDHRLVVVEPDRYVVHPEDGSPPFEVEREEPTPVVEAAMKAESVKGFVNWTRFPYWNVEELDDGWEVTFRDLRYVDPGQPARGIGLARVRLDASMQPVD